MSASSSEEDINRFTESYVRNFPVVQELKEKGSPLRSFKEEKRKEVPKNYYEQSYLREFPQKGKPQSTGKEVAKKGLKKGGGQKHFGQRQAKYEYSKNYVFRHSSKSDNTSSSTSSDTSSSASSNSSTSSKSFKFQPAKAKSQPLKGEPENVYEYYQRITRENNDDKEDPCQCSECQGRSESSNESGKSGELKERSSNESGSSTETSGSPRERSLSFSEESDDSSSDKFEEQLKRKKEEINFTQELIQAVAQRLEVRYSKADGLIDSNSLSQKIKLSAEQHVQNIKKSKMDTESQNFSFFNIKNLTADYLVKSINKPSQGFLILSYQEAISQLLNKPKVVNPDLTSTVAQPKMINSDLTSTVSKPKVVNPDLTSTAAKTKSLRDQQLQLIQQVRPVTSRKIQPSRVDKPKKKPGKRHLMSSSESSSESSESSKSSSSSKSDPKEKTYYQPRQFTWMLPQGQAVVVQKGLKEKPKETTKVAKLVEKDKEDKEDSEKSLEDSDSFHKTVGNLLDFSKKSLKKVPTIPKKYRR